MTFKEFMQMDELVGQYGEPKAHSGPLQLIKAKAKMVHVPTNRISAMMSAGGPTSPARPPKITSVHGPLTHPTFRESTSEDILVLLQSVKETAKQRIQQCLPHMQHLASLTAAGDRRTALAAQELLKGATKLIQAWDMYMQKLQGRIQSWLGGMTGGNFDQHFVVSTVNMFKGELSELIGKVLLSKGRDCESHVQLSSDQQVARAWANIKDSLLEPLESRTLFD